MSQSFPTGIITEHAPIFISHDLAVVKYISDQVMVMNNGEVVEMANSDELYRDSKHPYTRTLLGAIPKAVFY